MKGHLRVEPLSEDHDRSEFTCGVDALDRYLRHQAGQDMRKGVACCYVLTHADSPLRIQGFYTLSSTVIPLHDLPPAIQKKLPRYPFVPATLIGRLAVTVGSRGQGLGRHLLLDALALSLEQSLKIASAAVVVDAKSREARAFYEQYGFAILPDNMRLFLPMKAIGRLFAS